MFSMTNHLEKVDKKAVDGVIDTLISTYSAGAGITNALGQLPVHYAAERQCTPFVMKKLLDAYNKAPFMI